MADDDIETDADAQAEEQAKSPSGTGASGMHSLLYTACPHSWSEDMSHKLIYFSGPRAQCTVCQEADWKYKCPGCDARTCSLTCSKEHKANTGRWIPYTSHAVVHTISPQSYCYDQSRP